jgi:disulfide bond formation protein DsbB
MTAGWLFLLLIPLVLFLFDPFSHWSKLVIISLALIALLMGIQQKAASVRT